MNNNNTNSEFSPEQDQDLLKTLQALTEEIKQQRATAESLRDIIRMINSNMPLEEFLQHAVKLAAQRLGAGACVLHHLDIDNQIISQAASYGTEGIFDRRTPQPFSMLKVMGAEGYVEAMLAGEPNYGNYPPLPERLDEQLRDSTIPEEIKRDRLALRRRYAGSFAVPIFIQAKLYGAMLFYYNEPQDFLDDQIQLGMAFAEQVAVALENARLLGETEQRRSVAESLRETLSVLNTARPLEEILQHIVAQARGLLHAGAAAIHKLDHETGALSLQASVGFSADLAGGTNQPVGHHILGQAVAGRNPVVVKDTRRAFQNESGSSGGKTFSDNYGAVLAVPMQVQGDIYGGLVLYYPAPSNIQPDEVNLAVTFANQASLAIENALLRAQAAEGAALPERSRLARDLHDAVSQTLFSANLIAEVLPKLWKRSPETAAQKLDELSLLTRGALSEMRTMLLELRPGTLADMDLSDLVRYLANAFTARTRLPVDLAVEGQADLPAEVKTVFYRVAQEALNNIAKHAAASQVAVRLGMDEISASLQVCDDGRGFDPHKVRSVSMGLVIMQERAESIGARLEIKSSPGEGTVVSLTWHR